MIRAGRAGRVWLYSSDEQYVMDPDYYAGKDCLSFFHTGGSCGFLQPEATFINQRSDDFGENIVEESFERFIHV
ncbi:hypothetical protein [Candidatus Bealeia paramacronuclearis]|uniref:hypothetical protein n=1 Tax=Candidatus Bealeia paramacronuclearis TaxID=1921001 RepID=UPI002F269897